MQCTTRAVTLRFLGRPSKRTRVPIWSGWLNRTPHPPEFTTIIAHGSDRKCVESTRCNLAEISQLTRVPLRLRPCILIGYYRKELRPSLAQSKLPSVLRPAQLLWLKELSDARIRHNPNTQRAGRITGQPVFPALFFEKCAILTIFPLWAATLFNDAGR